MKKLILLTAVLLGAAATSQAGIRFSLGIGIPVGPPVAAYVTPAPVYVAPPVYPCPPAVVYQAPPPVVYAPAATVCVPGPSIYVGIGTGWCSPGYRWGHYRGWEHGHGHGSWHR